MTASITDTITNLIPSLHNLIRNLGQMLAYDQEAPMIFSSGLFWVLFLLFLPVYAALKHNRTRMILYVTAFSLYFYYKSSGLFFLMIIGTSAVDWSLSHLMARLSSRAARLAVMWLSITISLSILGYFKYANFFLWNWNQMVEGNFQPLDLILPVGISFYTFQSISYIVDVYRGSIRPAGKWVDYLFFLSFFPALVAGPIVRADKFLPQVEANRQASKADVWGGMWLVIMGIIKKALVADYISQYNDLVFNDPGMYTGVQALMGVLGYTMQIYCDFSGYSDMAIGIALIMGFKLGINFDSPYVSRNLTEFWRRWHISLSSWLRDYVYIPLGGNRKGTFRTYINNFLTMLIGGLWHGAAWKFIFWGAMHGVGLAVHKALKPALERVPDILPTRIFFWGITFVYVSLLWVFFRAADFSASLIIIGSIFEDFHVSHILQFAMARPAWCLMTGGMLLCQFIPSGVVDKVQGMFVNTNWALKLGVFLITVQLVIEFMSEEVAPFIYFQF